MNNKKTNTANAKNATGQLRSAAEFIANGETPIPVDWPEERLIPLLEMVHSARRRRMIRFITRVIATDICRLVRQEELQSDAEETI